MKTHWEKIYQTLSPTEVSWYQQHPELSLHLMSLTGVKFEDPIIDIGAGASVLVDHLLEAGFTHITVLDLSATALQHSQSRLGHRSHQIQWIEADVTTFQSTQRYKFWHDRAVFHFLSDAHDRAHYVQVLKAVLLPESFVLIATFAIDGPQQCSGLNVVRYDASQLSAQLGEEFELLEVQHERHITPKQMEQKFTYFLFRKLN